MQKEKRMRLGRKPLPDDQVKESIHVGLLPVEIVSLDRQCQFESKQAGITITRSEMLRKAWLEYARRKGDSK